MVTECKQIRRVYMRKEQSATWRKNLKKGIMALGVGASWLGFGSPAVQAAERTGEF